MANLAAFDWSKCIFCQRDIRNSKTNCPADSKRADVGSGYRSLCDALNGFINLGKLPSDIQNLVQYWDEGAGFESTFIRHRACWHIKCRQRLVHGTKLERLSASSCPNADPMPNPDPEEAMPFPNLLDDAPSSEKIPRLTRTTVGSQASKPTTPVCFFCELPGPDLRQVMTFGVHDKVHKCATIVQDAMLLAKLSVGDMIATEAKYHPSCLLNLYYKAGRVQATNDLIDDDRTPSSDIDCDSLALADVVSYLEDRRLLDATPSVFKLSDLNRLYSQQLQKHKVTTSSKCHSSRLKERLLANCPGLTSVTHGRDVFLTFAEHIGIALQKATEVADSDAVRLMHAAKLLRSEFLSASFTFTGSLSGHDNAVPPLLLSFLTMLLEGPGGTDNVKSEAAVSLSQLIVFNAIKRRRNCGNDECQGTVTIRHTYGHEMPLPLYIGLMLHSAVRKKTFIEKFHKLGLCVSYDRVIQIMNKTANAVCTQYRADNVVCPVNLHPGLFTVAAADNIDHNLSSSTAQASFHGTAVSVMQFPNSDVSRHIQCQYDMQTASDAVSDIVLPSSYTEVDPCILPSKEPVLTPTQIHMSDSSRVSSDEYAWLESTKACLDGCSLSERPNVSWAAFHAEQDDCVARPCAISALLPLFRHAANTPAMMRHCLIVIRDVVSKLNPRQIPVVAVDQPLYALMKQIQWHFPRGFGEDKFVVLLGGLHTEMAGLRMLGHWLNGSGWIQCLIQAGIATPGVAESFLTASHVKRTRYVHTVTAAALFINLRQMYVDFCDRNADEAVVSFGQWRADCEQSSVQFLYWSTVLELQLLLLTFVRSLRLGNFNLYTDSLQQLAGWFFVCDQTNYARWLPVHIRDMLALEHSHPDIYREFLAGNFTISKSRRKFSSLAIDHAHEQLNAVIKGEGGVVGVTESDAALCRWAVTAPELSRMLQEFEADAFEMSDVETHHEQTASVQNKFRKDVSKLLDVFDSEVPFSACSANELLVLCTNMLADSSVADSVRKAREIGSDQFRTFFDERLKSSDSLSVLAPIARNKLPLFSFKTRTKKKAASDLKLCELKTDCELFARLYIACQIRDGNLEDFFRHENQPYPPSLSQGGSLRSGNKSDLLECFAPLYSVHDITDMTVDCCILDGAVVVQMVRPQSGSTFREYKQKCFLPYLRSVINKVQRVDVVFDVYCANSVKTLTREKRGIGSRTRVTGGTKIPSNWQEFLRVDDNKTELFHFLADNDAADLNVAGKSIIMTRADGINSFGLPAVDLTGIEPCNHEEADTRIMLHCLHAARCGNARLSIRTVDTDIVVLAISCFSTLCVSELWIHFGVGKNVRLIPIHELCPALGPSRCTALPAFHALTGCDTVSYLYGKGKKSAWSAWDSYPQLSDVLIKLHDDTDDIDSLVLSVLERFFVILYDRTSDCSSLNKARQQLFTKNVEHLKICHQLQMPSSCM